MSKGVSDVPSYGGNQRRRARAVNVGSDNDEKQRSLKPSVCLRLHYNKMQDKDGLEGTIDAEYNTIVMSQTCTILVTWFTVTVEEGR